MTHVPNELRRKRDKTITLPKDRNPKGFRALGAKAARAGKPIWVNPHLGQAAEWWKVGWCQEMERRTR